MAFVINVPQLNWEVVMNSAVRRACAWFHHCLSRLALLMGHVWITTVRKISETYVSDTVKFSHVWRRLNFLFAIKQ